MNFNFSRWFCSRFFFLFLFCNRIKSKDYMNSLTFFFNRAKQNILIEDCVCVFVGRNDQASTVINTQLMNVEKCFEYISSCSKNWVRSLARSLGRSPHMLQWATTLYYWIYTKYRNVRAIPLMCCVEFVWRYTACGVDIAHLYTWSACQRVVFVGKSHRIERRRPAYGECRTCL